MSKKYSFTAASTFPAKLLHNEVMKDGKIIPLHIQLIPTNACNLSCSFCSCSDRDKKRKLTLEQITEIFDTSKKYGTKAVTVTGGGDPLMHKQINEIIDYAGKNDIEVGLVTNGLLLNRLDKHNNLTWCRISSSDDRVPAYDTIENALKINPKTDFAFSHVLTKNPNYNIIKNMITFANDNNFSHVRIVSDLLDLDNVSMNGLSTIVKSVGIDDSKVIYQGRKDNTKGNKNCYISLLKPVISPEGISPCCGAQYALDGSKNDMIEKMRMGKVEDLETIFKNQKHFDGSICDRCYYSEYNSSLEKIKDVPEHKRFV